MVNTAIFPALGRAMRAKREMLNFTLRQASREARMDHSTYYRAETGKPIQGGPMVAALRWLGPKMAARLLFEEEPA